MSATPPHSKESERAVLGAIMLDNAVVPEAMAILEPASFFAPKHRDLFEACLELWPDMLIDPVSLLEQMNGKVGIAYISALLDEAVTSANIGYHANIVADKAISRGLVHAGQQISAMGREDPPDV